MATIEKRANAQGKPLYRVKVRLHGQPPRSATFARRAEARKWGEQTEAEIHADRYFKPDPAKQHTLAALIDRYVADILPLPNEKKTALQRRQQLRWWQKQIGHVVLADIGRSLLAEQRDTLKQAGKSPGTVNRYLAALSHVFTIAVQEYEWMPDNPLHKVRKEVEPRGRVRYLSDEERDRLLAACQSSPNPDLYLAVVLSLATGARRMEVLTLRWSEIDIENSRLILLETKNGERRALPIGDHAKRLLLARASTRGADTDLLFPGADPSRPAQLRHAWEAALKWAAIANFRWHDLRHSAASYLAMNGASLHEIAAILGHKTLNMVQRYAHLSEQHTAGVVNRMNAKIFG